MIITTTFLQLRDHAAQLNINERGDLTYKVDVSGFRPEELKVEMQGNEIMVRGEHKEQNEGEWEWWDIEGAELFLKNVWEGVASGRIAYSNSLEDRRYLDIVDNGGS